jgi:hypothetical protein
VQPGGLPRGERDLPLPKPLKSVILPLETAGIWRISAYLARN